MSLNGQDGPVGILEHSLERDSVGTSQPHSTKLMSVRPATMLLNEYETALSDRSQLQSLSGNRIHHTVSHVNEPVPG